MSRPETVLQISVERDPSGKSNRMQLLRQQSVEEEEEDKRNDFRKRSISLFSRGVFKRSQYAAERKVSSSELNTHSSQNTVVNGETQDIRNKAGRSNSLPRR